MSNNDNVHHMHRSRMRERFTGEDSLDGFKDHEILEMVLYYSIPRENVNPHAHELLRNFGSLHGVFDANVEELMSIKGIGERSAVLLHMIPMLLKRYELSKHGRKVELATLKDMFEYCRTLLISHNNEVFYLITLDSAKHVNSAIKLQEGVVDEVQIYVRHVVEKALHNKAHSVILAHNHPNGILKFSRNDIYSTTKIEMALKNINIELVDHILIANNQTVSMRESKLL